MPAFAKPPSAYTDPKDRLMPDNAIPGWGFWNGRPWWWALGECAAWHRTVKTMNTTKQPDDRMMDFVMPMIERLQADRSMTMEQAMPYTRDAMNDSMNERVTLMSTTVGAAMVDTKCDALLAAYKKVK
ncbi:MAG: hypothetical protein J7494_11110 [Sphingobium sp.]|nr:hypothetical protein [Sphingobium sp.]